MPLSVLLPLLNLPFIAVGLPPDRPAFAIRSTLAIAALAVVLATVHYPDVTSDKVLTAVFGGFFLGAGIGLAIRGNAVLDGTEIAALLISKRSQVFRVGDVILGVNVGDLLRGDLRRWASRRPSTRSSPTSRRRGRSTSWSTAWSSTPR